MKDSQKKDTALSMGDFGYAISAFKIFKKHLCGLRQHDMINWHEALYAKLHPQCVFIHNWRKNMKRLVMIMSSILSIILLLQFSACQIPNALECSFAEGMTVRLEEYAFPQNPEYMFVNSNNELSTKTCVPKTFYLYVQSDSQNSQKLGIAFCKSQNNVFYCGDGFIVGAPLGKYGRGIYYFESSFDEESLTMKWEYKERLSEDSFVNFANDPCVLSDGVSSSSEYPSFLFADHSVYSCWAETVGEANEFNTPAVIHFEKICSLTAEETMKGGVCYDGQAYFITTKGLYRIEKGDKVALSAQSELFWDTARVTSVVLFDGKIYASMQNYGIYEYDIATRAEHLYRHDQTPTLLYKR